MGKSFKRFLVLAMVVFLGLNVYFGSTIVNTLRMMHNAQFMQQERGSVYSPHYLAHLIAQEMFEQQNRLFESSEVTVEAFDKESFEITLRVLAVPLQHSQNSTAQLHVAGETADMQWDDGTWQGDHTLPLGAVANQRDYRIAVTADGTTRSETFNDISLWRYFPGGARVFNMSSVHTSESRHDGRNAQESIIEIPLSMRLNEAHLPFGDSAASVRVFAEKEGEEIFSMEMEGDRLEQTKELAFRAGIPIAFYAEVVGESGITYRYFLRHVQWEPRSFSSSSSPFETGSQALRMTSADGRVMVEFWEL